MTAAADEVRPEDAVASILHVRRLVGPEHVGLGSDFDGATTVGVLAYQLHRVPASDEPTLMLVAAHSRSAARTGRKPQA